MNCPKCGGLAQPIIGQFALCYRCDRKPEAPPAVEYEMDDSDFWLLDEPTNPGWSNPPPMHRLYLCQACNNPGTYDIDDVADGMTCPLRVGVLGSKCGGMLRAYP